MTSIERLSRTRPPPGYDLLVDGDLYFRWYTLASVAEGSRGEPCEEAAQATHLAWNKYEAANDPPGMKVWCDPFAGDDVWWFGNEDRAYGEEKREEADARAAAWAWYWQHVAVVGLAERLGFEVPSWPDALALSDEVVSRVERAFTWLAKIAERIEP